MEKVEADLGKPYCDFIKSFYDGCTDAQCFIPVNLSAIPGCFRDNLEIEIEMKLYTDMFVEEMSKQNKQNMRLILCCVQCDAPNKDDIVRLIGRVEFVDLVDTKIEVDYVLFYEVDSGTEAINGLYPDAVGSAGGRSGKLSTLAKERIVKRVEAFLSKVHKKGIEVDKIICGRGLLWLTFDAETKHRFGKQTGSGALIPVVPGKVHLVRDTLAAFLQTNMENPLPFDQQLELHRRYNSENDCIDEEESLAELLYNDDDANIPVKDRACNQDMISRTTVVSTFKSNEIDYNDDKEEDVGDEFLD